MRIDLVTLVVPEYDPAIEFFVGVLGFELVEDVPSVTTDGRPKRWVVVRPSGGGAGLLLARADGEHQERRVGDQTGGRVAFFLRVDDFDSWYNTLIKNNVQFVRESKTESYGTVAVFRDVAGNLWDLIGA
ncbi:VOC family protein [Dactylosporangium sp. NPDC005572]|uniref:VOC family protein n=1 Tax=Dactylosporangium sp. NPDC005572 TaxID=3156889 RepID=UPI0033B94B57